ncbi:uncharacterized protein BDZ99DRAFT_479902 [Mytilinidion resinicola]|uniref:F-box domain-containing protein n=1 Tax=Mytilinidion resinicola TaxID=574789 RepID=A0A6A6YDF4_9PEZI|nr:uncharacterized protein BDZ99DRAFT_479902 [Mytilinidion resinicola]KAF2805877.1 hypothetical protein BDZ99DRAFT_479902 [Mytilinidion resinicola]
MLRRVFQRLCRLVSHRIKPGTYRTPQTSPQERTASKSPSPLQRVIKPAWYFDQQNAATYNAAIPANQLPDEILLMVGAYLSPYTKLLLHQTSQRLSQVFAQRAGFFPLNEFDPEVSQLDKVQLIKRGMRICVQDPEIQDLVSKLSEARNSDSLKWWRSEEGRCTHGEVGGPSCVRWHLRLADEGDFTPTQGGWISDAAHMTCEQTKWAGSKRVRICGCQSQIDVSMRRVLGTEVEEIKQWVDVVSYE